jgi:hypothetical protein
MPGWPTVSRPGGPFGAGHRPWRLQRIARQNLYRDAPSRSYGSHGGQKPDRPSLRLWPVHQYPAHSWVGRQAGWLPRQGGLGQGPPRSGPSWRVAGPNPSACIPRPGLPSTTPNSSPRLPRSSLLGPADQPPGPCAASGVGRTTRSHRAEDGQRLVDLRRGVSLRLEPAAGITAWPPSGDGRCSGTGLLARDQVRHACPGSCKEFAWQEPTPLPPGRR